MSRLPAAAVPVIAVIAGLPTLVAPGTPAASWSYTCVFAVFVVLAWLAVRRQTGATRAAYGLIAGALTLWLAGDLLYPFLMWRYGETGDVSSADLLWAGAYPLLAFGLIKLVRARAPGRLREAALDGLAMVVVVAALFWQFLIEPAVHDGELPMEKLFGALYPFGDLLLFAAGALLVLAPGGRGALARYLIAALTVTFVADVGMALTPLWFPDFDYARLDGALLLGNGLIAAALHHPEASRPAEPRDADADRLHPGRVVFLGISLLALPALADLRVSDVVLGRVTMLTAMVALTVIVLARFLLVVREQERGRAALAHRATHDQLTGLLNRQALHTRLTAALHRRSAGGPVVHFLDLNGFKPINDRYGHAAGDRVLAVVAERLRATVRATETVARLGGDEFVVVSATVADAAGLTQRLRAAVTEPIALDDAVVTVQTSIGVAVADHLDNPTSDALLAAADAAMYAEKAALTS